MEELTKTALDHAYQRNIGVAFNVLMDGLIQGSNDEAVKRFEKAVVLAQETYELALEGVKRISNKEGK